MSKNAFSVPLSEDEALANREKMTATKTAWKRAAVHTGVVCPSGVVISVKIPNLATLAEGGEIPNELVDIATTAGKMSSPGDVPADALEKLAKLQRFIISETVAEPAITAEEVGELPAEDVAFIEEIAYRQRDIDALGNPIAGLDKLAKYATFRDDYDSDEASLDA